MDIAQLGIKVDSATAVKATGDLDKLTAAGGRADVAVAGVGKASVRAAGGMSAGATNARMMALQLSQVAQQSMAGGGFIRALAIQLPDMALGFGAVGIAAGVVAGVALPLLASALGGTSSKAAEAATAIEGLDGTTKAYLAAVQAAAAPTAELAAQYGNLSVQARAALQAMSDVALVEAITATNAAVQTLANSLLAVYAAQGGGRAAGSRVGLADDFGLAADQAQRLTDAIVTLKNSKGLESQARAAAEVQRFLLETYGSIERMPPALQVVAGQMGKITITAGQSNAAISKLPALLSAAASAASSAAGAVGSIGNAASGAYGAVSSLVGKMYELAAAQQQAFKDASLGYGKVANAGGVDAIARAGNQKLGVDLRGKPTFGAGGVTKVPGGGGGSGGGGATDDFAARLAALQTEHESEVAQANKWYTDAQTVLADRRSIEVLGVQGHKDKLLEIEKIHQQQMAAIAANAHAARLNATASLFGSLASIAEIGGKKTAKAAAILAAIQTTVAGYATAMSAAAVAPTLIGKIAAYAGWIGTSAKAVAAIRSAGGIGGGGGIGSAPATQAIAPQAQESRLVVQGIKLTDILTGQMLMDILQKEFGARNVAFLR